MLVFPNIRNQHQELKIDYQIEWSVDGARWICCLQSIGPECTCLSFLQCEMKTASILSIENIVHAGDVFIQ